MLGSVLVVQGTFKGDEAKSGVRNVNVSCLVPNSTTRTPATDILYSNNNGQAHNNSTTSCTTNLPDRNARAQHLDMSVCWDVANFLSVGGEFVVQQVVELL